ncbi:MAG: MarR family winged helix-turn-helix transcriptional regulator [Myxococcota bacterium]
MTAFNETQRIMDPESQNAMNPHTPIGTLSENQRPNAGADPLNISPGDRALLETLVSCSLQLRLRGIDLESSTGLSGRELDLVALLTASGPTSVKSLVVDLNLPRSTMTAIVDRLEERGLVTRTPNPNDRRSVVLEATPSANEALLRYKEGVLDFVSHIKKTLSDVDQSEFTRMINALAKAL